LAAEQRKKERLEAEQCREAEQREYDRLKAELSELELKTEAK
jgi:hypothetical protein